MLRRLHLSWVVALLALVAVASAPVMAANPTDAQKREAGAFYAEGEKLFQQELYSAAIENFKKAHAIIQFPATLYNIARSYEKLGDAENCVSAYGDYVELFNAQNKKDPADIVEVRASVQKCQLLMRPEVSVGSEPVGAKVYINDKENLLGQTPFKSKLDPGKYTVYLDLDGYQPFEEQIEVRAGEPIKLFFKLEKFLRTGTINVDSNIRGATVFIDGRNVGLTPYSEPIVVDEGAHQVTVNKDDYLAFSRSFDVKVNETYNVRSELYLNDPPVTWKGYVGWSSVILGAGMMVGGYFAGQRAEDFFTGTDDFDQWAGLQKIGYGAGAGLLGVGIGLIIWESLDDDLIKSDDALAASPDGIRFTPVIGATDDGAVVGADVRF